MRAKSKGFLLDFMTQVPVAIDTNASREVR
jgi:hypothetical protein